MVFNLFSRLSVRTDRYEPKTKSRLKVADLGILADRLVLISSYVKNFIAFRFYLRDHIKQRRSRYEQAIRHTDSNL